MVVIDDYHCNNTIKIVRKDMLEQNTNSNEKFIFFIL